ncbi:MAG: hypothetical protein JW793_01040 [Acidobacteria bacterium]|nr:hypothetical protein [Acidobacteriota bacterium]
MKYKVRRNYLTAALLLGFSMAISGCGYKVRSSVGFLPKGIESLGIPTFQNLTGRYRLEQSITSSVLKEFVARTRIPVRSKQSGVDAVLFGEILSIQSTPVTFSTGSFGSAFMVTVRISAKLVRVKDSAVIWQDGGFTFRERYTLNRDVRDFFSEENPALERLANAFAASLVSAIIEGQSLGSPKP